MSTAILVKAGQKYYKARVNPRKPSVLDDNEYIRLCGAYTRQSKRGRLASMVNIHRRIKRLEAKYNKNPLLKSRSKKHIGANISYLLKHPGELTAQTPAMQRKQAVAIALSVWRRAAGKPQYKKNPRRVVAVHHKRGWSLVYKTGRTLGGLASRRIYSTRTEAERRIR